jgi:hypothetical protein
MQPALIKLAYQQVIDASSTGEFEKRVFEDTYEEFLIQAQAYNRENMFTSFDQLTANNPKANSLHYKVGFAIGLYVKELNNRIPGLYDSLNRVHIPFAGYQFEILASDITDKQVHKVSLLYTTDTLTLFGMAGNHMLLATGDQLNNASPEGVDTFFIPVQERMAIVSYRMTEARFLATL